MHVGTLFCPDTPLLCLPTYVTWLSPACRTVLAFERASKTFRHYDSAPGCSSARHCGPASGCSSARCEDMAARLLLYIADVYECNLMYMPAVCVSFVRSR
eukprot:scaffold141370_cov17-Tisochrysis_lutea.AAC.1